MGGYGAATAFGVVQAAGGAVIASAGALILRMKSWVAAEC